MSLCFPKYDDLRLARAPLREVVCQVRFPVVLRIASEQPYAFQDLIKSRFPVVEVEQGVAFEIESAKQAVRAAPSMPIYRFRDPDRGKSVGLAVDFFAVATSDYQHWEDFADDVSVVSRAFQTIYEVPFAVRIGLRYVNVFEPGSLNLRSLSSLLGLFRAELTAMIRTEEMPDPDSALQEIRARDGEDRFTLRSGVTRDRNTGRPQFVLDFDHFAEGRLALVDLSARCERYHDTIYNAFRWCIRPGKLTQFGPSPAGRGV